MKALLIAIAMSLGLVGAAHAQSKTIRYPETGAPSLSVTLPEGWTSQLDGSGNLIASSQSKAVSYSLSLIEDKRDLDVVSAETFQLATATPPVAGGTVAFQPGLTGKLYFSSLTINNQTLNARMAIVRIDQANVASATLISRRTTEPKDLAEAERVQQSIKIN